MDFSPCLSHRFSLTGFSSRISGLRKNSQHRKRALGVSLLCAALFLGSWAHELDESTALRAWLQAHPPSPKLIQRSLESLHYRQITAEKALQKVVRSLPTSVEADASFWISTSPEKVVYFPPS